MYDTTEYRIIRNTLRTLASADLAFGDPTLQVLASDAMTNLANTSDAEPTLHEVAYYDAMGDANAVEF